MKIWLATGLVVALSACATSNQGETRSYGNDALPSAEVLAFERAHAQYRYSDARIEWDQDNCAVYEGVAADGKRYQRSLMSDRGAKICSKP